MLVDSFRALSAKRQESVLIISHQERIMKLADEIAVIAGWENSQPWQPRGDDAEACLANLTRPVCFGRIRMKHTADDAAFLERMEPI